MTMGVKNRISSEYQRSFKSKYPCFTKAYELNVDYRIQRRSIENNHQVEPFLWDSDSSESSSELGICEDLNKAPVRPKSVPKHIHKHEKYNKAYHDHLRDLTAQLERNLHVSQNTTSAQAKKIPSHVQNEQTQTEPSQQEVEIVVTGPEEALEDVEPTVVTDPAKQPLHHEEKGGHHIQLNIPVQKKRVPKVIQISQSKYVPKPRPFSAPLGRPLKEKPATESKAPFVPYGFQDQEVYTANKKTYNIRASADIYPSALLAQKRRMALISKREEEVKSSSMKDKKKRALFNEFNEKVRRDTANWQTEYRSHFAGYNKEAYEGRSSARPASRHQESSFLGATW